MKNAFNEALRLVERIDLNGFMTFRDKNNADAAAGLIAQAIIEARREMQEAAAVQVDNEPDSRNLFDLAAAIRALNPEGDGPDPQGTE